MKALFYISTLFVFVLFSCTKIGKNVTVKGKVVNPVTGEPFSGVKAKLLVGETLQLPGGYKEIKSTFTDEGGRFELSAGRAKTVYLQVQILPDTYALGWFENGEYSGTSVNKLDKGKAMEVEYHLVSYGDYQLVINNINCQGINDTIIINQTNQVGSFLGIDWVLTGCSGYTTALEKTPIGNIHTEYTVIRSGVTNSYEVDFIVHPDQNNQQIINY